MSIDGPETGLVALFLVIGVGGFVLWILALIDAIRVPDDSLYRAGNKTVWILVIVLAGFIGAIIYYAAGRPAGGAPRTRPAGPAFPGAVSIDFRGVRYVLGRTADAYAIWDTAAGGALIRSYPLTEEGWRHAWSAYYHELEGAPPPPTASG